MWRKKNILESSEWFQRSKGKTCVNRDDFKIFEDQMKFQKECIDLVVKAVEALENTKYFEPTLASRAPQDPGLVPSHPGMGR